MNICPDCPNPTYVEQTGKCFECIDGEEPLDAEEEIANAPQQPQPETPPSCAACKESFGHCTWVRYDEDCLTFWRRIGRVR